VAADVEGVWGSAVAGALALELAMRVLLGLGLLQGRQLALGEDQTFLRDLGVQSFEPLLHRLEIMPAARCQ